jgi:hypothetical protein
VSDKACGTPGNIPATGKQHNVLHACTFSKVAHAALRPAHTFRGSTILIHQTACQAWLCDSRPRKQHAACSMLMHFLIFYAQHVVSKYHTAWSLTHNVCRCHPLPKQPCPLLPSALNNRRLAARQAFSEAELVLAAFFVTTSIGDCFQNSPTWFQCRCATSLCANMAKKRPILTFVVALGA